MTTQNKVEELIGAVVTEDILKTALLLKEGVDPNIHIGKTERTLLGVATERNNIGLIDVLVTGGADLHATYLDMSRNKVINCLIHACLLGHTDIVKYYLDCGMPLVFADEQLDLPLLASIKSSNVETVKFLLDKGATFGGREHEALWNVMSELQTDILKIIVEYGVDVNCINSDKQRVTPFMMAAQFDLADAISLLSDKGADLNLQDYNGYTALHYASEIGNVAAAKELISQGANSSIRNHQGLTPSQVAQRHGRFKIDALLNAKQA